MKVSRINSIERYVISHETVSLDELCEVFAVSKHTIRRDLNELEGRGHIAKVYGGVTAVSSSDTHPVKARPSSKPLIGCLAADEVSDGDVVFIDSGDTPPLLLRYLISKKRVTIVSHSLTALSEAAKYENLSVISLGGVYSPATDSFLGLSTIEAFSSMRVKKAFMCADGITAEAGVTASTFLEAELKRSVVRNADKSYCMIDASCFGKEGIASFCRLGDLEALLTDREPTPEYIRLCKTENVRLRHG